MTPRTLLAPAAVLLVGLVVTGIMGYQTPHDRPRDDDDGVRAGGLPDDEDAWCRPGSHRAFALRDRHAGRVAPDAHRRQHHAADRAVREDSRGRLRADAGACPPAWRQRRR